MMSLKKTPLYDAHLKCASRCAPFGGWLMPIQYAEGILAEHHWTRKHCTVFDICHMGEFIIEGDPVQNGFESVVTIPLSKMRPGACRYGFMLNEHGGIIDDVIVYKINAASFMMVVNAATTDTDFSHVRALIRGNGTVKNISSSTAKLDVQGPESLAVLQRIIGPELGRLGYYTFDSFPVLGKPSIISRTGYTGERGYEIYVTPEQAVALWDILLADPAVRPGGLGCRDTLRLEVGYPLYGSDINEDITPLEAGMSGFIDWSKDFIGKDALKAQQRQGLTKVLTGFVAASRRAPRHGYRIVHQGADVGVVTSGTFAPSLGTGIALGYVPPACAVAGTDFALCEENISIAATVSAKPFYAQGTAKQ